MGKENLAYFVAATGLVGTIITFLNFYRTGRPNGGNAPRITEFATAILSVLILITLVALGLAILFENQYVKPDIVTPTPLTAKSKDEPLDKVQPRPIHPMPLGEDGKSLPALWSIRLKDYFSHTLLLEPSRFHAHASAQIHFFAEPAVTVNSGVGTCTVDATVVDGSGLDVIFRHTLNGRVGRVGTQSDDDLRWLACKTVADNLLEALANR